MKKIFIIFLGIAAAFIVLLGGKLYEFYRSIQTNTGSGFTKPTHPPEKSTYTYLILGYGGANHEGSYLTDTVIVVHADIKKKRALMVSLPRDVWVKYPTESGKERHAKINEIYNMGLYPEDWRDVDEKFTKNPQGAAELVKYVIQDVTGLPVDGYVAVDFDGFMKVIDVLDGIDVNVEKTFDDYEYPIEGKENDLCGKEEDFKKIEKYLDPSVTVAPEEEEEFFKDKEELKKFKENITENPVEAFPCRYQHVHFDKGMQHMTGEEALKYARSRHSLQDGTDFGRAARQQRVIEAVKEKVLSIGFIPKIIPLLDEEKNHIKTDIGFDEMQKFFFEAKNSSQYKVTNLVPGNGVQLIPSRAETGQFILVPTEGVDRWDDIHIWIKNTIAGITPTPTPKATIVPSKNTTTE